MVCCYILVQYLHVRRKIFFCVLRILNKFDLKRVIYHQAQVHNLIVIYWGHQYYIVLFAVLNNMSISKTISWTWCIFGNHNYFDLSNFEFYSKHTKSIENSRRHVSGRQYYRDVHEHRIFVSYIGTTSQTSMNNLI